MLFKIPEIGNYKKCYESLCNWLKPEPLHNNFLKHNMKYLGHYVGVQGLLDSPEAFQVYDLYVYSGSKFSSTTFIAKFGDGDSDYASECLESLVDTPNNELKKTAVGEAYRRYKKRQICKGVLD